MVQLAVLRRKAGDEDGALEAARMIRELVADQVAEGNYSEYEMNAAMLAAFDRDTDGAIAALKSAVRGGLRWKGFLDDPVFENLQDEPGLVAVRKELDEILAGEHDRILQLICFNNPVPNEWQPLPETCEAVVERRSL